MNLKPVCLDEWLKKLFLETGNEYREKGLAVVCEALPPVTVKADTEHLRRVLTNIMDNSIKYKEKETVHLQITLEKTVSGVRMTLADDWARKTPKLSEITLGGIRLNTSTHRVYVEDCEVELENKEYELLLFFMLHADIVFSREELYEKIWGLEAMGDNATVVVHINRLREKIETDPSKPRYIQTVWGAGCRFKGI